MNSALGNERYGTDAMFSNYLPLLTAGSVAGMVLVLAVVGVIGIIIGSIKVRGVSLGLTGALFAGILFAHFCWNEHQAGWLMSIVGDKAWHDSHQFREKVLDFLRDGGLVLFVYAVGMQAGPSFIASFRANGLIWNIAAVCVVTGGFAIAVLAHKVGGIPAEATVGFYSGAVTNTPGLSAAQSAMKDKMDRAERLAVEARTATAGEAAAGASASETKAAPAKADPRKVTTSGYAVAYPMGILGVIVSMLLIRALFRVKPLEESHQFVQEAQKRRPKPQNINLRVTNPGIVGKSLRELLGALGNDVVISRFQRDGVAAVATAELVLAKDDILHAVGAAEHLAHLRLMVGEVCDIDIRKVPGKLTVKRMVVSNDHATGRSVAEQGLCEKFGITITRIERGGVEFVALDDVDLLIGDLVTAVGEEDDLRNLALHIGNSEKTLDKPRLESILLGITLGALLGSLAIPLPGVPAPVKFGMAGGPLLVAILLSHFGKVGPFSFYLSHGALHFMREFGIGLFLACVGLICGDRFFQVAFSAQGLTWILWGCAITIIPVLTVGLVLRLFLKVNYAALCGVLAGSMTDPPALAFATASCNSEAPGLAYAAVYPTTMICRIFLAQIFVILFFFL